MKPIKVLVASIPELLPVIAQVYTSPEFSFKFCTTVTEAKAAFRKNFDLVVCSVHFNNGQFYDLLRLAKAHPTARQLPFVVVMTGKESTFPYIHQSVEIAVKALGADKLVPIARWREEIGDKAAFEKFRKVIRGLVFGD